MTSRDGWRGFCWLSLAAGLGLRLWLIYTHAQIQGDSLVYGDIAANWLRHGVYGHTVGHTGGLSTVEPTLVRLPGYPAFLALCFAVFGVAQYHAVLYAQAIVDLCSCLLISRLTRKICGPRAARVALVLAALCPFTANYVAAPLTETLSIFCVALGFLALAEVLEKPRWVWVGLLTFAWSYAVLLRPDGALLAVVGWGVLMLQGRRARVAMLAGLLAVLPFVGWAVRNARTFHVFEPLAPRYANDPGEFAAPGFVRWVKTWAVDFASTSEIYWNGNSDHIDAGNLPSRAFDSAAQEIETRRLIDAYNVDTTLTPELDAVFARIARERIETGWLRYYVRLPVMRVADMWLRPRAEMMNVSLRWWQYGKHPAESRFAIVYGLVNLVYLIAACLGVWRWPPLTGAMVAFVGLRSVLLATLEAPEPRYTLECFPVVMVLAAVGVVGCLRSAGFSTGSLGFAPAKQI